MDRSTAIPLRDLSPAQSAIVDRYIAAFDPATVFVGAFPGGGETPKDIRPLFLRNGHLHILRNVFRDSPWTKAENTLIKNLQDLFLIRADFHRDGTEFWFIRPFLSQLLSKTLVQDASWNTIFVKQQCTLLFLQLLQAHRNGVIHGHIYAGNIGFDGQRLQLIDFATYILTIGVSNDGLRLDDDTLVQEEADLVALANSLQSEFTPTQLGSISSVLDRIIDGEIGSGTIRSLTSEQFEREGAADREVLKDFDQRRLGKFIPSGVSIHESRSALIDEGQPSKSAAGEYVEVSVATGVQERIQVPTAEQILALAENTTSISGDIVAQIRAAVEQGVPTQRSYDNAIADTFVAEESTGFDEQPHVTKRKREKKRSKAPPAEKTLDDLPWLFPGVLFVLLLAAIALFVLERQKSYREPLDSIPYQSYWQSNIPSKMQEVAIRAVVHQEEEAELVILKDVIEGNTRPNVKLDFLRIAFHSAWEQQLSDSDRQLAFLLGMATLLPEDIVAVPSLEAAHPGIILAVLYSLPLEAKPTIIENIPLSAVARLPQQFREAFATLEALGVKNFASMASRTLAKILLGKADADTVQLYLKQARSIVEQIGYVRILISLFPVQEKLPEIIDAAVLGASPPNMLQAWQWYAKDSFSIWKDLTAEERALIFAGYFDRLRFGLEQYADLLRFPLEHVRQAALEALSHNDFYKEQEYTIQYLASEDSGLSREQTVSLLVALSKDPSLRESLIAAWFSLEPKPRDVIQLLLRRSKLTGLDALSLEGARYLKGKEWEFSLSEKELLLGHKEMLVRALVYAELETAEAVDKKLLLDSLKKEKDPTLREQIQLKIEALK